MEILLAGVLAIYIILELCKKWMRVIKWSSAKRENGIKHRYAKRNRSLLCILVVRCRIHPILRHKKAQKNNLFFCAGYYYYS